MQQKVGRRQGSDEREKENNRVRTIHDEGGPGAFGGGYGLYGVKSCLLL